MEQAPILFTSRQRYMILFARIESMMEAYFKTPDKHDDLSYTRGLMHHLGDVLVEGIFDALPEEADEWETSFVLELETLYGMLRFADEIPDEHVQREISFAYQSVQFWRQTLAMATKYEALRDNTLRAKHTLFVW